MKKTYESLVSDLKEVMRKASKTMTPEEIYGAFAVAEAMARSYLILHAAEEEEKTV